jgi:hypothetical protein
LAGIVGEQQLGGRRIQPVGRKQKALLERFELELATKRRARTARFGRAKDPG